MSVAPKYIDPDDYDKEWQPKYEALDNKYLDDDGNVIGDATEYNSEIEKLDYFYAKSVSQKIQQKIIDVLNDCRSSIERNEYNEFESNFDRLNKVWKDFNSPVHYKMNARSILERV